jgi:H+/gluconate symporter-like permease
MEANTIGAIGVVIAIIVLVIMSLKGFNLYLTVFIATAICLLFGRMNVIDTMAAVYAPGFASFLGNYFFIFLYGVWLGKVMMITGSASSVARAMVNIAGTKFAVLAVPIIIGVLKYGGVDGNVSRMIMIPLIYGIFKESNMPRRFMPAAFLLGSDTFFNCSPGVPTTMNIVVTRQLGVPLSAAPLIGWIGSSIMLFGGLTWFYMIITQAKKDGEFFTPFDLYEKGDVREEELPNPIISLIPIIACAVLVNIKNADGKAMFSTEWGLFCAFVLQILVGFKRISWKKLFNDMGDGVTEMLRVVCMPAALTGFGAVVMALPAYEVIQNVALNAPGGSYFKLILSTNIMCACLGSATAATTLIAGTLGKVFVQQGLPAEAIARVMAQTSCAFDTVPHNGGVVSTIKLCGTDHKESYLAIFKLSVCLPLLASIVSAIVASIVY